MWYLALTLIALAFAYRDSGMSRASGALIIGAYLVFLGSLLIVAHSAEPGLGATIVPLVIVVDVAGWACARRRGAYPERMRAALSLVADACCVLAFVVIGRASHGDGETVAGIASTAWPFLAGLACGEVAARAWRRPLALVPAGVGAWLGAVVVGQGLRVLAGQGTARRSLWSRCCSSGSSCSAGGSPRMLAVPARRR